MRRDGFLDGVYLCVRGRHPDGRRRLRLRAPSTVLLWGWLLRVGYDGRPRTDIFPFIAAGEGFFLRLVVFLVHRMGRVSHGVGEALGCIFRRIVRLSF